MLRGPDDAAGPQGAAGPRLRRGFRIGCAANSLEAAIVPRAYHEFTYCGDMLTKIRGSLRPGGRLVMEIACG